MTCHLSVVDSLNYLTLWSLFINSPSQNEAINERLRPASRRKPRRYHGSLSTARVLVIPRSGI